MGHWAIYLGADTWASPCTTLCVKANVCIFGSLLFCLGDIALWGWASCAALCVTANVCALDVFNEVRFTRMVSFTNSGQCFAFPQPSTIVTCISGMHSGGWTVIRSSFRSPRVQVDSIVYSWRSMFWLPPALRYGHPCLGNAFRWGWRWFTRMVSWRYGYDDKVFRDQVSPWVFSPAFYDAHLSFGNMFWQGWSWSCRCPDHPGFRAKVSFDSIKSVNIFTDNVQIHFYYYSLFLWLLTTLYDTHISLGALDKWKWGPHLHLSRG